MKLSTVLLMGLSLLSPLSAFANPVQAERWQLENGVKVIFYPAKEVPMVDILVAFTSGSAYDQKQHGLSTLTANMLNQGDAGWTATQIAEALAEQGSQFGIDASKDMTALSLRSLSETKALDESIEVFAKIINRPDFPLQAFQRTKSQQLAALNQAQESPDQVADDAFYRNLYQDHPYAHPILGSQATVAKLTLYDVRQFYKRYYVGNNAVITIVGAVDSERAHAIADKLVKNLPAGTKAAPIPKAPTLSEEKVITIPFPSTQTALRLGQVAIDHNSKDFFPLVVGNYILGGGMMVSRLAEEVREKRGLTYGAYSQFLPMPGDGPFIVSLSTKSDQAQDALKLTLEIVDHFVSSGPSEQELTQAKQYLTGSFPLSLGSNRKIADILVKIAFYNLPDDYLETYLDKIQAVKLEEITQAFQQQIHPKQFLIVQVGNKA